MHRHSFINYIVSYLLICVTITEAASQARQFPAPLAPYVHPRVFTTAAELPQIKQNLTSVGYGSSISPWLRNSVNGQVASNGFLRRLADRNFTVNTVTEADINDFFAAFNEGSSFNLAVMGLWGAVFEDGDTYYVADAKQTAIRATVNHSILIEHTHNRYVNNDYTGLNSSTESAIKSHWSAQGNYSFTLSHTWRKGGLGTALSYDLLYNDMTVAQQDQSRLGLALSTAGWNMHGGDDTSAIGMDGNAVSNHYGYQGDEMVMLAAIYGETGFSQSNWDQGVQVMLNYLRVGFNESGYPLEDSYGPNLGLREGARGLVAMARQGVNEFETRADELYNIGVAMAHDIEAVPDGSMIGGESGGNYAFNSNSTSGQNADALYPTSAIIWKHVYPNDPTIDHWYRWRVGDAYNRKIRWQSMVDYAYFGQDYLLTPDAAIELTAYYPQRGKLIARNNTTNQAVQFVFDARPDAHNIGHDKSGRGHFSLNGLGRRWVSHIDFRYTRYSTESSTMHIDGVGQAYKAPSVQVASAPVDDGLVVSMAADLKYAYDWQWNEPWTWSATHTPAPSASDWEHETIDPRSFYTAAPAPAWVGTTLWDDPNAGYRGMWMWRRPNLPVEKAFRSIAYVRSDSPFVIIADDIKQDNSVHNYQSYLQLPFDLDQMSVNGNDAVLWATGDDRRLLVRVLHANAVNNNPISFQNEAYTTPIATMDARRLIVGVDAIDPQLKIMLWPHMDGDALPITNWDNDMTQLTVDDLELYVDKSNGYCLFESCLGKYGDSDGDGICNINDDTNGICILNSACDDNDPCTLNDRFNENCECNGSEELEVFVSEDAKVRSGIHADSNYGSQNYLRTKNSGPNSDLTREAFLKFDFNQVNDNNFNNVYLSLYPYQDAGGQSVQELYFSSDDSWTESGITWNNMPSQTQLITTFTDIVPTERILLDVTDIVNQEFTANKIISFKIREQMNGGHILYRSKENAESIRPKLIFSYDFLDDDNDSVCNALDLCPGDDDSMDIDDNGIPDDCDNECVINSLADAQGLMPGMHTFDFGQGPFKAYVDGSGWVLWLQYHHAADTNPNLNVIATGSDLPVYDPSGLGTNNSLNSDKWGHGSQAFASIIPDAAITLRWYGESSGHNRIIHFESNELGDFESNTAASFVSIASNFSTLTGHTANIPAQINSGFNDKGDYALTEFPFYKSGNHHWGIKGLGNRWEVDDYSVNAHHTIHRVWIKGEGVSDFKDADYDGVCDADDICPNGDDKIDIDINGIPDDCQCFDDLTLANNEEIVRDTSAAISIKTNGYILSGSNIEYHAGNEIELLSGFEVEQGAVFHVYISPCRN